MQKHFSLTNAMREKVANQLTVQAVEDGKRAAASIHRALVGQEN